MQDLPDVAGYGAQVAAVRGAIDVDDRLHIIVGNDRGAGTLADAGHGAQQLAAAVARDRHVVQFAYSIDPVLWHLHDDRIGHPVLRVQPERGRGLYAAGEAVEHAGGDIALGQADLCAKERSMFTFRVGASNACWIRASAMPLTWCMRLNSLLA